MGFRVTSSQLITGVVDDWDATTVQLRLWKHADRGWAPAGEPWTGVIGRGAAWGDGLHGNGPPTGRSGPAKREGDRRAPAGAFALRGSYGYDPGVSTKLPYTAVTPSWQCIDDPRSSHYTQILDRSAVAPDWSSAEAMRRDDALYQLVIDIAHNPAATPGDGSCVFFHVWRAPGAPTVGCTAMDAARLADLLGRLDPSATYVLLPRAEYAALAPAWGLPPL